jgi:hypothetical protein
MRDPDPSLTNGVIFNPMVIYSLYHYVMFINLRENRDISFNNLFSLKKLKLPYSIQNSSKKKTQYSNETYEILQ